MALSAAAVLANTVAGELLAALGTLAVFMNEGLCPDPPYALVRSWATSEGSL